MSSYVCCQLSGFFMLAVKSMGVFYCALILSAVPTSEALAIYYEAIFSLRAE